MTTADIVLFLSAAAVLSLSPGPAMMYVLARTMRGGWREGVASTLGTVLGGMAHVVAAAVGLSALMVKSAFAFSVLKYLGAAYLAYLGVRMILERNKGATLAAARGTGTRDAFLQGAVTEALNPKTAVFFLSFLPQFVVPAPGSAVALQFLVLGTICVLLNSAADLMVICFAAPLSAAFGRRPRLRVGQQVFCGGTLVGLGCALALSGRKD